MTLELLRGVDGAWKVATQTFTGDCDGVAFTGERRWWGRRWSIAGSSAFPMPEKLVLFVSAHGMEHGFWRDMNAGHGRFDVRHFVFCDTPSLLPWVLGPATAKALDDVAERDDALRLYVRDGVTRTTGHARERDTTAIARHVAVHHALAADHRAFLQRWQDFLATAQGRGASTWPPTGSLASRVGTLLVALTWELPPETRDSAEWASSVVSMRTELTAHGDRDRPRWVFAEAPPGQPPTHYLGAVRYHLAGAPPPAFERVIKLVAEGDIVSVVFGAKLVVSIRGLATAKKLATACQLIEQLLHAQIGATAPYR